MKSITSIAALVVAILSAPAIQAGSYADVMRFYTTPNCNTGASPYIIQRMALACTGEIRDCGSQNLNFCDVPTFSSPLSPTVQGVYVGRVKFTGSTTCASGIANTAYAYAPDHCHVGQDNANTKLSCVKGGNITTGGCSGGVRTTLGVSGVCLPQGSDSYKYYCIDASAGDDFYGVAGSTATPSPSSSPSPPSGTTKTSSISTMTMGGNSTRNTTTTTAGNPSNANPNGGEILSTSTSVIALALTVLLALVAL